MMQNIYLLPVAFLDSSYHVYSYYLTTILPFGKYYHSCSIYFYNCTPLKPNNSESSRFGPQTFNWIQYYPHC